MSESPERNVLTLRRTFALLDDMTQRQARSAARSRAMPNFDIRTHMPKNRPPRGCSLRGPDQTRDKLAWQSRT
jgi:hypothetical protein